MTQDGKARGDGPTVDVINQLGGLQPTSPVAALRDFRPEVVRHTQGSYDTLLTPTDAADLTLVERALVALRVAVLETSPVLIAHYRQRLIDVDAAAHLIAAIEQRDDAALEPRTAAIVRHVDLVTRTPGKATQADLQQLQASGLSEPAIVTLAQLIAFLSYQVRTLAAVSLLAKEA